MPILPDCPVAACFIAKSVLTKNYAVESILAAAARKGSERPRVGGRPRVVRGMGAGAISVWQTE
jgi:hypothetical protein